MPDRSQAQPPPTDWSVPRDEVAGFATTRRTVGDLTATVTEREHSDGWHWWVSRAGQDVRFGDVFESLELAKACADRALALEAEGDEGTLMDRLSAALLARARRTAEGPADEYAAAYGALLGALCSHPETLRALVDSFEALAEAGTA